MSEQGPNRKPQASDALPGAGAIDVPADDGRDFVLVKDGRRLVFRCAPGDETQLIQRLAEMAEDPESELTWFDAAVLSHQMGQRFDRTLKAMNKAS